MNVSEEYKITTGKITGETLKIDLESSIIIDGKSYTSNEFNEAVEMLKQPQLNENQQQVLGWLKQYYRPKDSIFFGIEQISDIYEDPKSDNALDSLTNKQEAEVIRAFIEWALDQEEA